MLQNIAGLDIGTSSVKLLWDKLNQIQVDSTPHQVLLRRSRFQPLRNPVHSEPISSNHQVKDFDFEFTSIIYPDQKRHMHYREKFNSFQKLNRIETNQQTTTFN